MFRALIILSALTLAAPALAQAESAPAGETPDEPIEKRLEKDMIAMPNMAEALSKNLGQLHYMRRLCFGQGDQTWRDQARAMMDIEAPEDRERRAALIQAFNDGFYDQQARFNTCSEAVSVEAAAIAENGRHLASMLGDPYRE